MNRESEKERATNVEKKIRKRQNLKIKKRNSNWQEG